MSTIKAQDIPGRRSVGLLALLLILGAAAACGGARGGPGPGDQLRFGVEMAREGLWQEALFRFERANRLDPGNPKVLNNLAVALEANGEFERALETYREALRIAPGGRDLKENYARFVDFYESYRQGPAAGLPGIDGAGAGSGEADETEPPGEQEEEPRR